MDLFTSDAMSSNPDFCLIFSSWIRAHISGSSCSRVSCPVHLDIRQCKMAALLQPYGKKSSHVSLRKHSNENTKKKPFANHITVFVNIVYINYIFFLLLWFPFCFWCIFSSKHLSNKQNIKLMLFLPEHYSIRCNI